MVKMFDVRTVGHVKESPLRTSILIPVFNEQGNIGQVVEECLKLNPEHIVVIDDASYDDTPKILKKYGGYPNVDVLTNGTNLGKQGAIKRGFNFVLGSYSDIDAVVLVDGDMQHPPEYIPKLVSLLTDHDVVITKRSKDEMPFSRKVSNRLVKLVYYACGIYISDMQTGYRAYNLESSKFINDNLESKGGYDLEHKIMEILAKMAIEKKQPLRIAQYEVPCPYGITESHIGFSDNLSLIARTVKTALRLRKYRKTFEKNL